jgi:cytochrome c
MYIRLVMTAIASFMLSSTHAQDLAAGKTVFLQCVACHSTDGTNGVGPSLKGVVGRKVGSFDGYRYSRAMRGVDYNWDAANLSAFLADPQHIIPGNFMPFSGIADARARSDLVDYLQSLR